jgi:hypothetical protein
MPQNIRISEAYLSLVPVPPILDNRASVKRFVSLQFLNSKKVGVTPWRGGSARRKAATYTNTKQAHTYINALSEIRTHDPSVRASEGGKVTAIGFQKYGEW